MHLRPASAEIAVRPVAPVSAALLRRCVGAAATCATLLLAAGVPLLAPPLACTARAQSPDAGPAVAERNEVAAAPSGAASGAAASASTSPASDAPRADGDVAADSPRAALDAFLGHARAGEWAAAARYLDLPASERPRALELTQRLHAVLARHVHIDLDALSPLSGGRTGDGLPRHVDEVGRVPSDDGPPDAIRLQRTQREGGRWLFTRATIERIDGWYDALPDRWIRERLPATLRRPVVLGLMPWQWFGLLGLIFSAAGLGWLLGLVTRAFYGRAPKGHPDGAPLPWRVALVRHLAGPIALSWSLVAARLLLPWLALTARAEDRVHRVIVSAALAAVFWAALRSLGTVAEALRESEFLRERPALGGALPIGVRIGQVVIAGLAVVVVVHELGYPVASILAGLGVGGLAVALAAQKTFENLFGSVAIGVDQPFRTGDFVKVDDVLGHVELVGLRSTRIRTLDRTLVTLPNGRLADMRIENYSARDRLRFVVRFGVTYDTTGAQLRNIVDAVEAEVRLHPDVHPEDVSARLVALSDSSLDIEVSGYARATTAPELGRVREALLLRFLAIVEEAGAQMAFPTRTVHVVSAGSSGPGDGRAIAPAPRDAAARPLTAG